MAGDVVLARYTAAGTLDGGFGTGGRQAFDLGGDDDVPAAVLVQPDGRIVAAGTTAGSVALLRALPDGRPDASFSGDGVALVPGLAAYVGDGVLDRSADVALQPDGKLLVANRTADGDFAVARLTVDGQLDASFGTAGVATVDFGGEDDADAVLVQETGEILLIGTSLVGNVGSTGVAALDPSGALITGFGENGRLTLDAQVTNAARELHVGDLVLRAFGARQADGRLIVGTGTRTANAAQVSSSLRRLDVPGVRPVEAGTSTVGTFGSVRPGEKPRALTYTDADGTTITFALKNGSGTLTRGADGRLNLSLSNAAAGGTLGIRAKGGDGRVSLGDVMVGGTLRSLVLKTGDLSGTLFASGSIGKVVLGDVSGTVATGGSIGSVVARKLTGARVMAGAALGADGKAGGAGANADSFNAAALGAVKADSIAGSTFSAGVNPAAAAVTAGRGASGTIRSVSAKQADASCQFIAGKIGSLKLPNKVDPASDERVTLTA
jgi:uncharacterized delta-60 repeat protein